MTSTASVRTFQGNRHPSREGRRDQGPEAPTVVFP